MGDVLVVDDITEIAQRFADLVYARTGISARATDDPDEALDLVREGGVKVVLLDERMPRMSGTVLWSRIRDVDPRIKAIMLTGEADGAEVAVAFQSGFADYLQKADLENLDTKVMSQLLAYETARAQGRNPAQNTVIARSRKRYLVFGGQRNYFLDTIQVLEERYIRDSDWRTVLHLNVGQERKIDRTIEVSNTLSIEESSEQSIKATFGLKAPVPQELAAGLERVVKTSTKTVDTYALKGSSATGDTFKLPDEPSDRDVIHLRSRLFHRAPIFRRMQANLRYTCEQCGTDRRFSVVFLDPSGKFATRHEDWYSNGDRRLVPTGEIDADLV